MKGLVTAGLMLVLLVVGLLVAPIVRADSFDDETREIAKRLQCPICEGVSVADSPSELAGQMRAVIRRKLEQGESQAEIVAYFVERYGDAVLVEPPRRGFSLAVWLGPIVVLMAGLGLLAVLLRGWLRPRWVSARARADGPKPNGTLNGTVAGSSRSAAPDSYVERARRELERFRQDG